jgi:predicted RNase H-like nuclease (RuvC/YqgF family)
VITSYSTDQGGLCVAQEELKKALPSLASANAKCNSLQNKLDTAERIRQHEQESHAQIVQALKRSISTLEEELRSSSRVRTQLEDQVHSVILFDIVPGCSLKCRCTDQDGDFPEG